MRLCKTVFAVNFLEWLIGLHCGLSLLGGIDCPVSTPIGTKGGMQTAHLAVKNSLLGSTNNARERIMRILFFENKNRYVSQHILFSVYLNGVSFLNCCQTALAWSVRRIAKSKLYADTYTLIA